MVFMRDRASLYEQPFLSYGTYWILNKKIHKYKKTLKISFSKNKSFHNLQKVSKSTALNTMVVDL